ncbi:TPA: TonB-dependent receptor domain-containing protein [Escherichia coli]
MKIVFVRQTVLPALLVLSPVVFAADEQTMIVSAAPQVVSELDTPAAVSVVDGEEMRLATPRINLSESLTGVPGLQVQNRQNYAQDLQLSIRGFGSRSTYGIRGIRLYVDGIPATMPDGQGQTSNIDLSSVQNVEVLRGPFSALYGNASGGVMNVTTQTGQQPPTIEASSYYGSFGSWRYGLKATGATGDGTQPGDVDYTVSTTRFTTHGYRDHSGAQKNLANAKLGVPVTFTTGLNYENMSENRKGYNNFRLNSGMPEYGQKGELRRDERNLMWNIDPYLQTQWQLSEKLSLDAGVRYSSVWFDSNDHYVTPGNGDDSGDASYHKWLPAGSLKYAMTDAWNIYLAAGRGFETPTINELSYRADGQSGMNFGLKPSTNDTIEIGSKTRIGDGLLSLALFQTDTDDEIVVDSSSGGRTTYKNAGKTRRQGAELAWDQRFAGDFRVNASWTWLDATYRSNVCNEQDCNGNRMPGIARNMGFASIGYVPEDGWYAGMEARYMGDIMADDENTAKAPSYTLVGLFTGYKYNYHNLTVDLFGRVDNLFDKEYVGSVIVNESNGRYYEPAPGRNYGVGVNIAWRFE